MAFDTRLIIVRHGNTFASGEVPRRVGARTDLPLVDKGLVQAEYVAAWLQQNNIVPDVVISGPLKRHTQSAEIVTDILDLEAAEIEPALTEVDYGPDENKVEADVISRIGEAAMQNWNDHAIVPAGWQIDVAAFQKIWRDIAAHHAGKTILVITSNGTARFALHMLPKAPEDLKLESLKLGTGCIGILAQHQGYWRLVDWNVKPTVEKKHG